MIGRREGAEVLPEIKRAQQHPTIYPLRDLPAALALQPFTGNERSSGSTRRQP